MDAMKTLQSIKKFRTQKKLSVIKSAELSGVGRNFISDVERGKVTAEFGKVAQYAQSLGLNITISPKQKAEYDQLRELIESLSESNPLLAQRIISGLTDEDKEKLNSRFVLTKKQAKEFALKF